MYKTGSSELQEKYFILNPDIAGLSIYSAKKSIYPDRARNIPGPILNGEVIKRLYLSAYDLGVMFYFASGAEVIFKGTGVSMKAY